MADLRHLKGVGRRGTYDRKLRPISVRAKATRIGPVRAFIHCGSGSLRPGLSAHEIAGEYYWTAGVSN